MTVIYKYAIAQDSLLPRSAKPLCVQKQDDVPMLWAEVDDGDTSRAQRVHVCVTGGEPRGEYVGTFQDGWFVGHVYVEVANDD